MILAALWVANYFRPSTEHVIIAICNTVGSFVNFITFIVDSSCKLPKAETMTVELEYGVPPSILSLVPLRHSEDMRPAA